VITPHMVMLVVVALILKDMVVVEEAVQLP
jgi:hypothetical protein